MKHTLIIIRTLAVCMAGSLMAGNSIARQASSGDSSAGATGNFGTSTTDAGQPPAPPQTFSSSGSGRSERLSQMMGATVKDQQGESIGQINDFVVNPMSGRIQFAVISLNDQSGKLTAIPWQLVRPGTDPTTCTLSVSKNKLEDAQTFDASSWPDFGQPSTTQQIYSHYGVQPQGHMGWQGSGSYYNRGGVGTGGSSQYGTGGNQQQYPQNNNPYGNQRQYPQNQQNNPYNSQGGRQQGYPQSNP